MISVYLLLDYCLMEYQRVTLDTYRGRFVMIMEKLFFCTMKAQGLLVLAQLLLFS